MLSVAAEHPAWCAPRHAVCACCEGSTGPMAAKSRDVSDSQHNAPSPGSASLSPMVTSRHIQAYAHGWSRALILVLRGVWIVELHLVDCDRSSDKHVFADFAPQYHSCIKYLHYVQVCALSTEPGFARNTCPPIAQSVAVHVHSDRQCSVDIAGALHTSLQAA
jgi:hypothetical protein